MSGVPILSLMLLVPMLGAVAARKVQSGYLTSYALIMLLGLVAAISWVLV